jgi:Protein of unknown function (DUF2474)
MSNRSANGHSWPHRLGWLLLLWLGGVVVLAAVALLLRGLMLAAGLKD